jgi:uncharacterized membrane protein/membrane-bound inhibitor of C-type lysozyme
MAAERAVPILLRLRRLQPLLLACLLSCSPLKPYPAKLVEVYHCSDAKLVVERRGKQAIWIFAPGFSGPAKRVPAASGEKWQWDGGGWWWDKGRQSMLHTGGAGPQDCRRIYAEEPWEKSKLAGYDFRAVGHEPEWSLELGKSRGIFIHRLGGGAASFAWSPATQSQDSASSRYTLGRRGSLLLIPGDCADTMDGRHYATQAILELDGQRYQGCGQALH